MAPKLHKHFPPTGGELSGCDCHHPEEDTPRYDYSDDDVAVLWWLISLLAVAIFLLLYQPFS